MSGDGAPMEALVGSVLDGAYRLVALIGQGGMGAVYEAVHTRLNKRVAVKVMAHELATVSEALARFRREAEVTSGLGHPHIVQVFDFGTLPSGEPYFVMEFMEGEDLDHRLRRVGRLSPHDTLHIIKQVAGALDTTHQKGIVHRDLKPANVYLLNVSNEPDFVKVLDFGISKVCASTTKLTKAAMVMGTPNYMSPEQAMGQVDEIDERTDQWALACIVWEALSGRCPFVAQTTPAVLFQVVYEPPAPFPGDGSSNQQLVSVLTRALAKNKTDRFPSVLAFASALEEAILGRPLTANTVAVAEGSSPPSAASTAGRPIPDKPDVAGHFRKSTLSESTGELGELKSPSSRPGWLLPVIGGAATLLLLGILLVSMTRPASKATQGRPSVATSTTGRSQIPGGGKPDAATEIRPAMPVLPSELVAGKNVSPPAAPTMPALAEGKKTAKKGKSVKTAKTDEAKPIPPEVPNCNPNFFLDAQGEKHFKRECFLNTP